MMRSRNVETTEMERPRAWDRDMEALRPRDADSLKREIGSSCPGTDRTGRLAMLGASGVAEVEENVTERQLG